MSLKKGLTWNKNLLLYFVTDFPASEGTPAGTNSSMVRLRDIFVDTADPESIFQFQHGAIKRLFPGLLHSTLCHFNSSMVRLRGDLHRARDALPEHFNSSMVRLRVVNIFRDTAVREFQFQHGTIKRKVHPAGKSESEISIPAWYD